MDPRGLGGGGDRKEEDVTIKGSVLCMLNFSVS